MIFHESDADGVRIEITVAAPVDEVWQSFRDKEKVFHWHGWDAPRKPHAPRQRNSNHKRRQHSRHADLGR